MRPESQRGSATLLIMLSVGLSLAFLGVVWRSLQAVREAQDFQKGRVAYYAAEAGLQTALSYLESGSGMNPTQSGGVRVPAAESGSTGEVRWTGKAGQGIYEATAGSRGVGYRVTAKGYYYPAADREISLDPVLDRLDRSGGGYKNVIKAEGQFIDAHFAMDGWEKYP